VAVMPAQGWVAWATNAAADSEQSAWHSKALLPVMVLLLKA